jgi:superfamily II DNA or RNA helicase
MNSVAVSYLMRITLYSHNFCVDRLTARGREVCFSFAKTLIHYKLETSRGHTQRVPSKVFAASNQKRSYYRFHINQLADFKRYMNQFHVPENLCQIVEEPMYEAQDVVWTVKAGIVPRDYQEPAIDYFCQDKPISKLLTFATGKGKTLTTQLAIAKKGKRILIMIKLTYIQKWIDDMVNVFGMKRSDIAVLQGNKSLLVALNEAKEGKFTESCVILSNTTYQAWVTLYEQYGDSLKEMGYPCAPHELCSHLKIGERIIDEVHQHFHFCFKSDLYLHVPSSIALSATLINRDTMLQKLYQVMFPPLTRYKELELDRYQDVVAVLYMFNNVDRIRTTAGGNNMFSNGAVEQSIMRHIPTLKNWLGLIARTMEIGYIQVKREKKKLLIYCYSIDMIVLVVDHLRKRFPHLDIRKYTQEDPYKNLFEADVCVTTIGSAGTAVDIPDLTNLILTTNVASEQANIQVLGRLRQLKDGHPVTMHYLVASNLQKSVDYHKLKMDLYANRVKTYKSYSVGYTV